MSRLALLARLPTVLRSLRRLRTRQALAQLQHLLVGLPAPRAAPGEPPRRAIDHAATPFLMPPAHVRWLAGGSIELLATPFRFGEPVDWETTAHGPLFAYHLHQHDYLRAPEALPAERTALMLDWIDRHPHGIGWDPHPISLRLLAWGKLLVSPGDLAFEDGERATILASMADQAETLAHGLEVRLQANHLLSNLISVVWSGLLMDGRTSDRWRALVPRLLVELDEQVRPDGLHEERSPMYHALLLEGVLDLLNLCVAAPERVPDGLESALRETSSRMLVALEVLSHPDGRIALFADSGFDVAADLGVLRDYARRLGVVAPAASGSVHLPQSGYLRLRAGELDLIASVGGPSPAHQPGHAHCDALAFELSLAGERLVTDTGCLEYRPGPRRDRARSTASHATIQIDGEEQAELWAAHRMGGRPEVVVEAWDANGVAEASCRGWSTRATLHRRRFEVDEAGVTIVDRVEGPTHALRCVLPFDPRWQMALDGTVAQGTLDVAGRESLRVVIDLPAAFDWRLERAAYYPSFGREQERWILVGVASHCEEAVMRLRRGA